MTFDVSGPMYKHLDCGHEWPAGWPGPQGACPKCFIAVHRRIAAKHNKPAPRFTQRMLKAAGEPLENAHYQPGPAP